jgi:GTP cyclohydrolase I
MTDQDQDSRRRGAPDRAAMQVALENFLVAAGLQGEAAPDAAQRCAEAWAGALVHGYEIEPAEVLEATFDEVAGDLVTVSSVPFVSVCAHHLLPFFGFAHIAYLPGSRLLGLGRLEELVRVLSRRLQLQEKLGHAVATALVEGLDARGAACILEAEHMCVFARGRRQRGPVTRTTAFAGELRDDPVFRQQCLALLGSFTAPAAGSEEND